MNLKSQVTEAHYLCYVRVLYNLSKYREHMGRSLGLEICWKMDIKIDETYHASSFVARNMHTKFREK